MLSIPRYLVSLMGGKPVGHRFDNTFFLMISAVFAGYTVTKLHPDFLKEFEHPLVQFVVFYIIGISSHGGAVPPGGWGWGPFKVIWGGPFVFYDAILTTFIFQMLVYVTNTYYESKEQKNKEQPEEEEEEKDNHKDYTDVLSL